MELELLPRSVVIKDYGSEVIDELDSLEWSGNTWTVDNYGVCNVTHFVFGHRGLYCFKKNNEILGYYYVVIND